MPAPSKALRATGKDKFGGQKDSSFRSQYDRSIREKANLQNNKHIGKAPSDPSLKSVSYSPCAKPIRESHADAYAIACPISVE
jgi:hypothetical protein